MKKTILSTFTIFIGSLSFSQAVLVKDFNIGSVSGIPNWEESSAKIGENIIFTANDGIIGSELYLLKEGKVSLIKDIVEGVGSSTPNKLIAYKNKVYFSAQNENGEFGIYSTDGTVQNTSVAIDLKEDRAVYEFFVANNGKLYFNLGRNLYSTEGTEGTTQKINLNGLNVDFDKSWTYASTNIVNYKNGVAFSAYKAKDYYILYHNGSTIDTLTKFTADTYTNILGPVTTKTGLVFGVQDSFTDELIATYHVDNITKVRTELKINDEKIDLQRIHQVNGQYCLIKPFSGDFYSFNGTSFEKLSIAGTGFLMSQGELLPHAVNGNSLFFLGKADWFDTQYYITDGTAAGTVAVETPETSYPGRNIIVENGFAYMFQGTTNGFTASIVKIDFTEKSSEVLYASKTEATVDSDFEIINIQNGEVYFAAQLSETIGRELYLADPTGKYATEFLFPTSGSKQLTSCDTTFYDNGGPDDDYSSNVNATLNLIPDDAGKKIILEFTEFDVENIYDYLNVNNNSKITKLTGDKTPSKITSTAANGGLTLTFKTDGFGNSPGFIAKVSCQSPNGIQNLEVKKNVIYPNPSSGTLYYQWSNESTQNIIITDLNGITIFTGFANSTKNELNLNSLQNGMYEIRISDGEQLISEKLIIAK